MKKRKIEGQNQMPEKEIDELSKSFLKSCLVVDDKAKKLAFYHLNKKNNDLIEEVIKLKGKNKYTWHDMKRATDKLFDETFKSK